VDSGIGVFQTSRSLGRILNLKKKEANVCSVDVTLGLYNLMLAEGFVFEVRRSFEPPKWK
jgi:hypothetical protein